MNDATAAPYEDSTNEHEREHGVTYASAGIQRHAKGIRYH